MDRTGKIWDYSQRGKKLSIVAPSGDGKSTSDIVTTDRMGILGYSTENYYECFGGTSAACPQVSGVAALLLSIRPDLTVEEIRNVLQNTATDLGTTGYDTTYGYGLLNAEAAVKAVAPKINGKDIAQSTSTYTLTDLPENAIASWRVEEENKDKITLTQSGNGNSSCTVQLSKNKTVRTRLIAEIKVNGITVTTVSKNIAILGMFSGTYSVPAVTISGVSLPAIVDRPFTAGSTLEARRGCYVYIKSDDLRYYTASWSGNKIENWTYNGLDELRFSYPVTASSQTTILQFTGRYGGSAKVNVLPTNPPTTVHVSQEGQTLSVAIIEETQEDYEEFVTGIDEISMLNKVKVCDQVWTIEVLNAVSGSAVSAVTTSTGECEFDTSTWQSGIYLIRVSNGTDVISKKITIQ